MKYSVRVSLEANKQIEAINNFIARDSPEQAKRWRENLFEQIRSLKTFPEREVAYSARDVGRDIRQILFGAYGVLYTIEADTIVVLIVRHGARRPLSASEVRKLN